MNTLIRIALAVALAVFAPTALATVHVITDVLAAGITHCGRYEGGVFKGDSPVTATKPDGTPAGGNICSFDISAQPVGSVTYTATAVAQDPLFGRKESPQSLPLSVTNSPAPTVAPKNLTGTNP